MFPGVLRPFEPGDRSRHRRVAGLGRQTMSASSSIRAGASGQVEGRRNRCAARATTGSIRPMSRRRMACGWNPGRQDAIDADPARARAPVSARSGDPKAQAWYAKTFGGKAGIPQQRPCGRRSGRSVPLAKADTPQARTLGRVLDHIGFDVKDLKAFIAKSRRGIKLDEPLS